MPPIKFRPTEKSYDRRSGRSSVVRYYMKAMPKKELIDYLNGSSSTAKKKHKVLKEPITIEAEEVDYDEK